MTFIILFIVGIVAILQTAATFRVKSRLAILKSYFSNGSQLYKVLTLSNLPADLLDSADISQITSNNFHLLRKSATPDLSEHKYIGVELRLIESKSSGLAFNTMLQSINAYLIRNRGAAADFSILRDITDRSTDVLVSEVEHSIPIPLYYGLAGTLVCAVLGLLSLSIGFSTISGQDMNSFAASTGGLVLHVALAMVTSALGIILTAYNSNFSFKPALAKMEADRNQFLSFLQAELLPHMTVTANSALQKLQDSLKAFNNSFTSNLGRLEAAFNKTVSLSQLQADTAQAFASIDAEKMATTAEAMAKAGRSVGRFVTALENTEKWLESSQALTGRVDRLLDRTDAIAKTAQALETGVAGVIALNQTVIPHLQTIEAVALQVQTGFKQEVEDASRIYSSFISQTLIPNNQQTAQKFSQEVGLTTDMIVNSLEAFRGALLVQQRSLDETIKVEKGSLSNLKKLNDMDDKLRGILYALENQQKSVGSGPKQPTRINYEKRGPVNRSFMRFSYWIQRI